MNKLRLIVLFLLGAMLCDTVQAQEIIYSGFEDYDFQSGSYSVVGKVQDRLYVYRGSPANGYYLDAYNDGMSRVATVVLDFFPEKSYDARFITYDDKILVMYQAVDGNKITENAALLDAQGRLVKGPTVLDTEKTGLFGGRNTGFSVAVSENKKHIIVYGVSKKRSELNVKCIWIDDSLQVKQRHNAEFKGDNTIDYGDGIISNNGTFYLAAYTPVGSRQFADQIWLLALTRGERKFLPFELNLDMNYAGSIYMKADNSKGKIYIGGFYSPKKNGSYEGVVYAHFNMLNGNYENHRIIPFGERVKLTGGTGRRAFNDYVVRQMIIKNDGGFVLVSENYFVTSRSTYPGGFGYYSMYYPMMSSVVNEYHYGDIQLLSFGPEGNFDWQAYVRKDQYSQEDGGMFSSYLMLNTGGTLGFMYNDFNFSDSRMQLAGVDGNGQVQTRMISQGRGDTPDWLVRSGKQISAREVVVPCLRKKQICYAKVIF